MSDFNYLKQENVTATAKVTHKDHGKQNMFSVLYSYDKNISKLVIPIVVAGDQSLDFSAIKRVRILLTFNHEGVRKSIEDIGDVESADNGTLSYIVTDKLKGYEGNVTMNIYLDLTTEQQVDLAEYGFTMKRSVIDRNIPEIEQFYFKSLDDVIVELQRKSDEALKEMNDSLKVIEGNLTSVNSSVNSLAGKADDIQKQINDQEIVNNTQLQNYLAGKTNIRGYSNGSVTDISGIDLNNLFESGTFKGNNMTNAPDSGWWFIQNLYHTKTYDFQVAWHLEKSTDLNPQVRAMGAGVWGTWRSLATINDQEIPLADLLDSANFSEYSTNVMDKITVRRSGNVVQICGTLTTALNKEIPAGEFSIFAKGKLLPAWAKTRGQLVITTHQGSNTAKFMTRVTPEGDIMLGRYSDSSTTNMLPITAGRWLPINIIYIV